MSRVCEAEAMDSFMECLRYQSIVSKHERFVDHAFVKHVLQECGDAETMLDVGTGPGLIPIRISRERPDLQIRAVDVSAGMLTLANQDAERHGVADRVLFEQDDAKSLSSESNTFDIVISHAMLHHLRDPLVALEEMVRVLRRGGRLVVKDILRPPDWAIEWYVKLLGSLMGYSPEEKRIYDESLRAAFSVAEMAELVSGAGFLDGATVSRVSFTNYIIQYTKPMTG